jgi:hypothetical protein
MPVQIFDRADPNRNRTHLKWFDQLRADHMRLTPGRPGMPMKTDVERLAAGVHEVELQPRSVAQPCKNCRKATRESTWVVRCGPCGELFSPVLTLFVACEWCGWAEGAMGRLEEHLDRTHPTEPT